MDLEAADLDTRWAELWKFWNKNIMIFNLNIYVLSWFFQEWLIVSESFPDHAYGNIWIQM